MNAELDWSRQCVWNAKRVVVTEWVPVSERLPERGQMVLEYYSFSGSWFYAVNHDYEEFDGRVTAWMPIPEYKERVE